jgi:hypothetical protein
MVRNSRYSGKPAPVFAETAKWRTPWPHGLDIRRRGLTVKFNGFGEVCLGNQSYICAVKNDGILQRLIFTYLTERRTRRRFSTKSYDDGQNRFAYILNKKKSSLPISIRRERFRPSPLRAGREFRLLFASLVPGYAPTELHRLPVLSVAECRHDSWWINGSRVTASSAYEPPSLKQCEGHRFLGISPCSVIHYSFCRPAWRGVEIRSD